MELLPGCDLHRGSAAVLFVAPHGGRRPQHDLRSLPANLRVNDLYTAELARELARRLEASAIVNHGIDRNEVDLNRVSQLRRRAPWLIERLAEECERLAERHPRVTVFFLHGWNTGQARCDLGVGATGTVNDLRIEPRAALTADPVFLVQLVGGLERVPDLEVSLGARYPAGHPNNVVQLFRRRDDQEHPAEQRIAELACSGRVQAIQLELGVPLRWPGPWRDAFVEALVAAVSSPVGAGAVSRPLRMDLLPPGSVAVQGYDAAAGIGLFAAVGAIGERIGARLLLTLGGQRIALYTGEESVRRQVTPLHVSRDEYGIRLRFAGPMLQLEDASLYLDLENAMAHSRLVQGSVDVVLRYDQASAHWRDVHYGRLSGTIDTGARHLAVSTPAVGGSLGGRGELIRSSLSAVFEDGEQLMARVFADGRVETERVGSEGSRKVPGSQLSVVADAADHSPTELCWTAEDHPPVTALPVTRMPIVRGLGRAGYLRVTFGIARIRSGDRAGHGLFEHSVLVPAAG